MSGSETLEPEGTIELEYDLDTPPEKVWRAVSIPELLQRWLPDAAPADPEALSITDGEEVHYRLRETVPPFLESIVKLRLAPNGTGGTILHIVHEFADVRPAHMTQAAANANGPPLMRAA